MMNFRSSDPAVKLKEKRLPIFGCLFEFATGIANYAFSIVSMSLLFLTFLLLISVLSVGVAGRVRLMFSSFEASVAHISPAFRQSATLTVSGGLNLQRPIVLMIGQFAASAGIFAGRQANAFLALWSCRQSTDQQFATQGNFFLRRMS